MCLVTGCPDNSIRSQRRIRRLCFKHDIKPLQDAPQVPPYNDGKEAVCDETCPSIALDRDTSDFETFTPTPPSPPPTPSSSFLKLEKKSCIEQVKVEEKFPVLTKVTPVKSSGKPTKKSTKESSEKRKEKSREAARCRRSKESELYSALSDCLPLPRDVLDNLDKASIMRLAIACLHTGDMLHASIGSSNYSSSPPEDERLREVCGQYQEAILQAVDGFVLALSCSGDVAYVSASIARYLGLPQVDVMGISLYDLVHQCDHQDLQQLLAIPSASKASSGPQLKLGCGDITKSSAESSRVEDGSCDGERHLWEPRHGFLRMKCTLASKGRNVTIRNASYKVVEISGKLVYRPSTRRGVTALGWLMCMASPVPHPANIEVPLDRQTFFSKHSLDMKFVYADENFPQFCGFTPSQLEGQSLFELHHEQDGPQLRQAFVTLRTKGQVNTGRYRFLVLGGGYIWIVTQATVISGQRESAPSAIVCLHYVISGVEQPGLVLSCVQLLPHLCTSPPAPPPALEGAGADGASTGAAEGVLAMTVTALPNTNSSPSSSHSSGKPSLKLVARRSSVLFKPSSPSHLIPSSGPHTPNLDDSIVSDSSLLSLDPSFCADQAASETASYLAPATSLTTDPFTTFEGSQPSCQSSTTAVGELQPNSLLCNAQSSVNTEGSFFGISLNVNVSSEPDSSTLRPASVQSQIVSAASQITQPAATTNSSPYGQSTIASTPLLERETGSSPLLSQSAAGVWDVKSFSKQSIKEEGSSACDKECADTLLPAEPLSLEQYLFPDSSCDSASLDLFEDIQQQSPEPTLEESMDFISGSPFLKTEEFFEGDCIEGCAPLLHLNEDESLIMWSPGTEEPSSSSGSSSSGSNNSSLSSSPCKRGIDSCDGVFSPDSGFDGGLFSCTDERGFGSGGRRIDCSRRDSPRRSSFSELLQLSSSPPLKGSGDAPASCIDPNTVWPGLLRSQPPQGDKPLDFEQLLQEEDDEPSSSPTLASVLLREDPCDTPHSSCSSSSTTDQSSGLMHTHASPKPPRREYKTRPFTVPLEASAVSTTRLLTASTQKTLEEPQVPSIKRPPSPYETRQLATRKRVCATPTSDETTGSPNVPFKSSRPLIKPNMPCVEQLLVSKCVPDKNSEGGLYNNKNQTHSVLRNLLVSGHDSTKEHYVLPLSPSHCRDRSPPSLSKCSSADSDSADDPPDTSSPPPRAVSPLRLARRSFRSSRQSKASILEAVSSSAVEEDSKPHDSPKSPTPTLMLHSNSLGRMKLLRLAPAHRSVYATRGSNGRLQLFAQRAPAKVAQSVVLEDCAASQSMKSSPVLVKSTSAVTAPYALHFCSDAVQDCAQVLKLKGCGDCAGKKVLLKRRANKDMTATAETPCKRQLLVARETAVSTPISWLSLSPSGRWTAAGDHHTLLREPTNKHRVAKPRIGSCGERGGTSEVFSSNGQNQHSECLFMEDSDSPSVTIVPFL